MEEEEALPSMRNGDMRDFMDGRETGGMEEVGSGRAAMTAAGRMATVEGTGGLKGHKSVTRELIAATDRLW